MVERETYKNVYKRWMNREGGQCHLETLKLLDMLLLSNTQVQIITSSITLRKAANRNVCSEWILLGLIV